MAMIVRSILASFFVAASAVAQKPSLDEQIAAAEAPLTELRDNYRKALELERDKAQAAGNLEVLKLQQNDLKAFEGGRWPEGGGINSQRDATFIIHYWRIQPKVDSALRKIAGAAKSPEINARIQTRLDHWLKEPPGIVNKGSKLLTYRWKLTRNPVAAGILGSSDSGKPIKDHLKDIGVGFPEGATAVILNSNVLMVNLLPGDLVLLDQWLRSRNLL
ncbi:hypothetical protein [Luteolibacter sp. Populi]|uniref:hypothetical protein n=1 Tax=Luteolibacter sp. Populi TaxID=3230487 RepID=UPI003467C934